MARKTRKVDETPVYPIAVEYDSHCSVTRHKDPDEQWDGDDLSYSTTVKGIRVAGPKQYHDFTVPFEPVVGTTYYLVVVTYSTGDSFHHEDGRTEYVSLWTTPAGADKAAKAIVEHYRAYRDGKTGYRVEIELEGAREPAELFTTWCGYFERMEAVEVLPVSVGAVRYVP